MCERARHLWACAHSRLSWTAGPILPPPFGVIKWTGNRSGAGRKSCEWERSGARAWNDAVKRERSKYTVREEAVEYISEWRVFQSLDNLRPTATGLDQLPAWFLRLGAPAVVVIWRFCPTLHSVTPAGHPGPAPSPRPNPRLSP